MKLPDQYHTKVTANNTHRMKSIILRDINAVFSLLLKACIFVIEFTIFTINKYPGLL